MTWKIEYTRSAQMTAEKLDSQTRRRIRDLLEIRLAAMENPRQIGDALTGPLSGCWRYRVGDYRIICRIEDTRLVVLVIQIGHRSDVYR